MRFAILPALLVATAGLAQPEAAWVSKSNQNTRLLLDIQARYAPEQAGRMGIQGLDEQISVPNAQRAPRFREDLRGARQKLEARLREEQDPLVRQDLDILMAAADQDLRESETEERLLLPYVNVAETVFFGVKSLLDDQVAPERRKAALVRLRRYTGLDPAYSAITTVVEQNFRDKLLKPELLGPSRIELEKDLGNTKAYLAGIGQLLEKYHMEGYQPAYAKLQEQLAAYDDFLAREVLPRARPDFRLPLELYRLGLAGYGVDYSPEELARMGHQTFTELQGEMQALATKIAKQRNLPSTDYRNVIRELKKEQLSGEAILPHYQKRLADIEAILRREHLVTLPDRPAIIRLATAAETAQQPAPHMQPPPMLNNHGERGQFVLPLETKGQSGKALKYDDFTFAAASWTLTSHEARPGHEMQFAAMLERGVSQARAIFAFNSTNVEGWGLYAEWFMVPYMPDEGKLISLQFRLLRAARAFLDPELQRGAITPEQGMQVLQSDVVCSEGFATEEIDRFTFRSPGQAVSYFDGYLRLREIRAAAEKALGPKFDVQRFHDFILSQGLLPAALLRKAVLEDFVPTIQKQG